MEERNVIGLDGPTGRDAALAERKTRLKRQADFYRVGIVHAKASIKHSARPDALLHNALDRAGWAIRSRIDGLLRPTGVNVAAMVPYAVSIFGFITRRRLVKPALGVLAAAAGIAFYVQRRRNKAVY